MMVKYCELSSVVERAKMIIELSKRSEPYIVAGKTIDDAERSRIKRRLKDKKELSSFWAYRRNILRRLKYRWGENADVYVSIWEGWNSGLLEDFMVSEMNVKLK